MFYQLEVVFYCPIGLRKKQEKSNSIAWSHGEIYG